ncbi:unnamed protein product [Cochlearia groenlandica]
MFSQSVLATQYENLTEDHENLKQDYASLEKRFKDVEDLNTAMNSRLQNQNQIVEPEATKLRLLKELERERGEKDEYKKMFEEMKKIVAENESMIDYLRKDNKDVLRALEIGEEALENMKNVHDALAERFIEVEKKYAIDACQKVKDAVFINEVVEMDIDDDNGNDNVNKNGIDAIDAGQGGKHAVLTNEVVEDDGNDNYNVKKNVIDAIVISDESDGEYDNPPRESNITSQSRRDIKQEQVSNGTYSSQAHNPSSKVYHPYSPSSSSSSSSDDYLVVQVPVKRP